MRLSAKIHLLKTGRLFGFTFAGIVKSHSKGSSGIQMLGAEANVLGTSQCRLDLVESSLLHSRRPSATSFIVSATSTHFVVNAFGNLSVGTSCANVDKFRTINA